VEKKQCGRPKEAILDWIMKRDSGYTYEQYRLDYQCKTSIPPIIDYFKEQAKIYLSTHYISATI